MKRDEFKYNVFLAGQGDHWEEIEKMVNVADDRTLHHIDELRDAAYRYLCISTDYQKLYGFLVECDKLNRSYCLSWDQAVEIVSNIIILWGK